jgi:hypothetical protein
MNDFMKWFFDEAPEWVRYVALILFVFFLTWALFLIGVLVVWAGRNGYWIVFAIPPVAAIWAVLNEYKKSKEKQDG